MRRSGSKLPLKALEQETIEEENKRIDKALEAIDTDNSLNEEERRLKKAELLGQASEAALDAQMAAHSSEAEYIELISELREDRYFDNDAYYNELSREENIELNQSDIKDLQTIKPILPSTP